jgi:hypothetical protein
MTIRLDTDLAHWIMPQVVLELAADPEVKRSDVLIAVLSDYARSGDAERYVRADGKPAWRMSRLFRQRLADAETD